MSSITIWVTEHFISQRVGMALKMGLPEAELALASAVTPEKIAATPIHIGYGILRGMGQVAKLAAVQQKHWFIADLGYIAPGHFTGNYRIAYSGTQSLYDEKIQSPDVAQIEPWREKKDGVALICPPTEHVCDFFSINEAEWVAGAEVQAKSYGLIPEIRHKKDAGKESLDDALGRAACVIAFNSAVAWQALQKGIPALSDVTHSTVGSWHGKNGAGSIEALKSMPREKLFRFMAASQLSLLEIQQGKIRDILGRYAPALPN